MEITYSADGSVSDEETAAAVGALANEFDGRMYIGFGNGSDSGADQKDIRCRREVYNFPQYRCLRL